MRDDEVHQYWENRAKQEYESPLRMTSNDPMLAVLEVAALQRQFAEIPESSSILELGCGSGRVLAELSRWRANRWHGVDFSATMIEKACSLNLPDCTFEVGDIKAYESERRFDAVFMVRALTNLTTIEDQRAVLDVVVSKLKVNGLVVLLEPTLDGLDAVNQMRIPLGLEPIRPHAFNLYLRVAQFMPEFAERFSGAQVQEFSSSYYLVSRVLNAALAKEEGRSTQYGDALNNISLKIPQIGTYGCHKMFVARRAG